MDGKEAVLEKSGGIFRGVHVEAGTHRLSMKYDPVLYRNLAYASGLVFLLGFAVILRSGFGVPFKRKKESVL